MNTRHCSQCGAALGSGNFCSKCGTPAVAAPKTQFIGGSAPRLRVQTPNQPAYEIPLGSQPVRIGRETDNEVVVPFETVSRRHAKVMLSANGFMVMDLGSANGTFLQGQKITPQQAVSLLDGQVIRIGDAFGNSVSITFLATGTPPVIGTLQIGPFVIPQGQARLIIGRAGCFISLPHPTVSSRHAELLWIGNTHQVHDLGSTNGTFVNGNLVRRANLKIGDQLKIGPYKLTYQGHSLMGESNAGNMRVDGLQLYKAFWVVDHKKNTAQTNPFQMMGEKLLPPKKEKVILNNISLTVMPKEFVALVGGSGAGKSTLMDALNGFRHAHRGQVLVNGSDLYKNYDQFRTNMGYVPQQDILHIGLTVQRALWYAAQLRLPPDTPPAEIEARIHKVLQEVEMDGQKDQQISSLSGGQRKRVSIASELISDPSLFFLDEPTSGLDPGLDKKMMGTLRKLADGGRTIVLTTHATNNIIGQCDHVCFLSYGELVYYGPPQQAMRFFQASDFADIYSKLNSPQNAQSYRQQYHNTPEYQQCVTSRQKALPQPQAAAPAQNASKLQQIGPLKFDGKAILRQFAILSRRYLELIFNDRFSLFILLAVMPIIGLLLLLIANSRCLVGDSPAQIESLLHKDGHYNIVGEAQKLLLMMALPSFLLGIFASAYEIVKEKAVYLRERMINLSIPAYLGSKVAVLMGFGLLQSLALMGVVALKVDYPSDGVFLPAPLEMYLTLVLALFAGIAMGLLISALVKSSNTVIYLILVVLIVQIIFSGALFDLPDAAKGISVVTPTRWALEGLGSSVNMGKLNKLGQSYLEEIEVDGSQLKENPMGIDALVAHDVTIDAEIDFSVNYKRSFGHLTATWLMLLLLAMVSLMLAGVALKRQDKRS